MPLQLLFLIATTVYDRAREPSSHAGLAALSQALKYFLPPQYGQVADAAAALFASLAVILAEKGAPPP